MAKKKAESAAQSGSESVSKAAAPKEVKEAAAKKPAAKKTPAAKGGAKKGVAKKSPASPAGSPLVDTGLAAQNAARMLASRAKLGSALNPSGGGKESASFKQLKESVNNPGGPSGGDLSKALGPQKTHLPASQYNQIFHNQTQGGVGRINLPRRTGG